MTTTTRKLEPGDYAMIQENGVSRKVVIVKPVAGNRFRACDVSRGPNGYRPCDVEVEKLEPTK